MSAGKATGLASENRGFVSDAGRLDREDCAALQKEDDRPARSTKAVPTTGPVRTRSGQGEGRQKRLLRSGTEKEGTKQSDGEDHGHAEQLCMLSSKAMARLQDRSASRTSAKGKKPRTKSKGADAPRPQSGRGRAS